MSETYTRDNLIAGDFPMRTHEITVVSGAGVLARGTVLGKVTASGKYNIVNNALSDGTETAAVILLDDIDATSGDIDCSAAFTGEFNENALVFGGDDVIADHRVAMWAKMLFTRAALAA